ncbi:hypothetical protein IMZ11_31290 [Microtetraspora sp. AC03309]|uniref:hypothetical protein n=1 Tax=Microtetraspora sp. AC03309 TaxID=2779376 RepID=UPI001E285C85|nr:hypothetical protein [Microtetraspora sp. AC03309]MCC5580119.1 hypothetical protein [Microtetraspora sp. AC03309]
MTAIAGCAEDAGPTCDEAFRILDAAGAEAKSTAAQATGSAAGRPFAEAATRLRALETSNEEIKRRLAKVAGSLDEFVTSLDEGQAGAKLQEAVVKLDVNALSGICAKHGWKPSTAGS